MNSPVEPRESVLPLSFIVRCAGFQDTNGGPWRHNKRHQ